MKSGSNHCTSSLWSTTLFTVALELIRFFITILSQVLTELRARYQSWTWICCPCNPTPSWRAVCCLTNRTFRCLSAFWNPALTLLINELEPRKRFERYFRSWQFLNSASAGESDRTNHSSNVYLRFVRSNDNICHNFISIPWCQTSAFNI